MPFDTVPIESLNSARVRSLRPRSRAVIKSTSRASHPNQAKGDILVKSRSFKTENSPELFRRRTQLRSELSSISREFNAFLHNSATDSLPSINDGKSSVPNGNNLRHEATRINPLTSVHTNDFQSGFPETNLGNIHRNQDPTPGNEVVRELQRLNSLLRNNGPSINSGNTQASAQILSIQNPTHADIGNGHSNVPDLSNQLSFAPHSSHVVTQQRDVHPEPKIVLLRNRNSARPLNVQIGNTRLEVLGGRSGSASQLVIQTVKDAFGSMGVARNNLQGIAPPIGFENPNQNVPSSFLLHGVNQSQKSLGAPQLPPLPLIEQALATAVRDPLNANNLQVPLTTTAVPVPVVTTPLTPSGALRQILGPGISDILLRQMAQDILPPELQRLDAIMRGQSQLLNTVNNNTNAGMIQIGNQTHALNLGNTKKIKITQNKTGTHAVVSSLNTGGGPLRNIMVTEEPMEYDEILLRKVLQKMSG